MKKLTKVRTSFPVTLSEIEEFETQIGFSFPSELKDFLLEYAGSRTLENNTGGENPEFVDWFYRFDSPNSEETTMKWEYYNLIKLLEDSLDDDTYGGYSSIREKWLPFADSYNDMFCIKLAGDTNVGAVYLYRLHTESDSDPFEKICDSFEEFINSLVPDDNNYV
jgi:cell wall assembly regulator SMI1